MGSKPRLDVSDRHPDRKRGECGTQRARRVALDDEQIRCGAQARKQRRGHCANVSVRIFVAGTIQCLEREAIEIEFPGRETVLAGEDQRRRKASRGERAGEG